MLRAMHNRRPLTSPPPPLVSSLVPFLCRFCRRVLGFWLALTFGTALQAVAFGVLISRFDWNKEVQRAATMLRAAHCSRGDSIGSS
jgi:hypothetical protein